MSNRLYYMKVFFLQYKAFILGGLLIFILGFSLAMFVFRGPKVPETEEDFTNALKTGEHLFEIKRYKEAFEYLVYPGEHGYPKARFLLGEMYYNGWGVEQDNKRAFENYTQASEELIEARYMAASMAFRGEVKNMPKGQATTMLTEAAYHGSKRAQMDLGIYSLMSADYEQAYFWLSLAAQGGYERAENALKAAAEKLSEYQRGLLDTEIKGFVARK
ncbi:MAG: sel1 repeat family protein [Alphaproteobacteria bacterium]|nr:sel1 repeat family protein [Alphaproteobacteria bacterium]